MWGQPGGSGGDVRLKRDADLHLLGIGQVATGQVHLGGRPSVFVNLTFRCCPKCPIWAPGRFSIEGVRTGSPPRPRRLRCVQPRDDRNGSGRIADNEHCLQTGPGITHHHDPDRSPSAITLAPEDPGTNGGSSWFAYTSTMPGIAISPYVWPVEEMTSPSLQPIAGRS